MSDENEQNDGALDWFDFYSLETTIGLRDEISRYREEFGPLWFAAHQARLLDDLDSEDD
jgi:hypothetical protein